MANFSGHSLTLVGSSLYCYGGFFFEKYNTVVRMMETGTRTTLESDMKSAFITNDFADVTFRFPAEDNSLVQAHKIVLASRSQKFRDMLQGRHEEDLIIDVQVRTRTGLFSRYCYCQSAHCCPTLPLVCIAGRSERAVPSPHGVVLHGLLDLGMRPPSPRLGFCGFTLRHILRY